MPCYNCANTVEDSIESIYQQNLTVPFELVCCDDASTDNTRAILQTCQQKYPYMHILVHEHNKGAGAARNTAIRFCHGDLIFCLDADNILVPNSVGKLIDLLDYTRCDGAAFDFLYFFIQKNVVDGTWHFDAPNNICDIFHIAQTHRTPASSGNYLYTKKSYNRAGGYPERPLETWGFGFRQHATGAKIALLPNSFYWHRNNPQGYWHREERTGNNNRSALQTVAEFLELYTPQTRTWIKKFNTDRERVLEGIDKGKLQLLPHKVIEALFKAYAYEEERNYKKAIKVYNKAIAYGAKYGTVLNRLAYCKRRI
jgi:glycosyltransferase involved in cell wall biosynthesis